jgi:hypothetical protein
MVDTRRVREPERVEITVQGKGEDIDLDLVRADPVEVARGAPTMRPRSILMTYR